MQGAGELIRRCAVLEKTALEIVQSSGVWGEAPTRLAAAS